MNQLMSKKRCQGCCSTAMFFSPYHITHLVALHGPKLVHDLQVMGDALIPGGFVGKQIDDPWIAAGRHKRAMTFEKTGVFDVAMMDIFENCWECDD